jgi:hypothetical protein
MRDDTELQRINDLSQPFPWEPGEKKQMVRLLTGALIGVALLVLGVWKLAEIMASTAQFVRLW